MKPTVFKEQFIPISLSAATFVFLCILLFSYLLLLNSLPGQKEVVLATYPKDILVGFTIYVKTAIDFALFIGSLMAANPGVKNRIAIELGTSFGNGIGTLLVLSIWFFFKAVPLLLAIMIILAAIVLLAMAEEGFESVLSLNSKKLFIVKLVSRTLHLVLTKTNPVFTPIIRLVMPKEGMMHAKRLSFWRLVAFAFVVPFILGLDDFAGYIPLFSLVNVLGFAIGAFLAHLVLTACLFVAPHKTVGIVKNPFVLLFGSLAFIVIALYGIGEAGKIILELMHIIS